MSLIRIFVATLITTLFLTTPSFAQSGKGDKDTSGAQPPEKESTQVEVETDRSSGKTAVRLKSQVLIDTPEHKLTMQAQNVDEFSGVPDIDI